MKINETLLASILERPEDDTPRLVYADWLDAQGQRSRAEFIRVQCEIANLDEYDPRRPALEERERAFGAKKQEGWLGPLDRLTLRDDSSDGVIVRWEYRRGFIAEVTVLTSRFLLRADVLLSLAPIEAIEFWAEVGLVPELARSPFLSRLTGLRMPGSDDTEHYPVDGAALHALASSPYLTRLTALDLAENQLREDQARILSELPFFARITSLSLVRNRIRDSGLSTLAASPFMGNLNNLDVALNGIGAAGTEALAKSPHIVSLSGLSLSDNSVGDEGARALARSPQLVHLRALDLERTSMGDEGVKALSMSPHLSGLKSLNLSKNDITAEGASVLADSPWLTALTSLNLSENSFRIRTLDWPGLGTSPQQGPEIGDAGARAFAASTRLSNLRKLDLGLNRISDDGARALAASPHLERLQHLRLTANDISEEGMRALRRRFGNRVRV